MYRINKQIGHHPAGTEVCLIGMRIGGGATGYDVFFKDDNKQGLVLADDIEIVADVKLEQMHEEAFLAALKEAGVRIIEPEDTLQPWDDIDTHGRQ